MRVAINRAAVMILLLPLGTPASARDNQRHIARQPIPLPYLAYTIHGRLWLRSLHGNRVWPVSTPWPVSGLLWSPDGSAIAFAGRRGIGVATLSGDTLHTMFTRRLNSPSCCEGPKWSPDGRYLEFSTETRNRSLVDRWLRDRTTGRTRILVRGATGGFGEPTWAHDGAHLALSIGVASLRAPRNPAAEIVNVRSGHVVAIGRGIPGEWSPDDRFLGFDHLWVCGATGCFEQEGVIPSSGGAVTVLDRYVRGGWLTYETWTPRRYGYAYDRWLLGPRGHVLRRIPGRFDRVESWSPDGHWVAVRYLTRSLRIVLTLVNADTGRSIRLFVSSPEGGCDACVNQGYELTWNHSSTAFVMLTPYVFGGFKEVNPTLYLYTLRPGRTHRRLSKGIRLFHPNPTVLGWMDHDRAVIVYSGRTLFR